MQRNSAWFTILVAVLSGGLHESAQAQQIKPYFLVIVDTSGSMEWCAGGTQANTGGNDCSCRTNTSANCSTNPPTPPAANLFKTNRCGFPSNRIGDAKCALQRIIDGTGGDAVFGLMQFEHPCSTSGTQCNASTACSSNPTGVCDDGQLVVEIQEGNASVMRQWVDGVDGPGTCDAANHRFPHELKTGLWTPLAQSLQRANEYLRGNANSSFPWATDSNTVPASPIPASDPQLACRPVSVILLTDGDDTCAMDPTNDPPARAATLNAGDPFATTRAGKAFKTFVIGFGTSAGFNPTVLDNIAQQGGTDSPDATHRYFPAMNEAELSLALNKIIADSQPPSEVCNNADDDCDLKIDEGLQKYCDKPNGVNDATLCMEPKESLCDGKDDDCDGLIDEELTNACGMCGPVNKEVCDNTDNDCDSRIDEDTNSLMMCGKSAGECEPGQLVCTNGVEQCQGEIGPKPEVCDCKDNDCDEIIDEEGAESLCGQGKRCAGCKCVEFCVKIGEFDATCSPGLAPEFQSNGECLCIVDNCDHQACPKSSIMRDGMAVCEPDSARVAECSCRAGACVPRCDGVSCDSGKICSPKTGRCVENNCRGLGCASGELCDPGSTRCVKDACATANCEADQVCRDGTCETSCAKVECKTGERCEHGSCVANKCATRICEPTEVCDPTSGECSADKCAVLQCANGQACSQSTGLCEADPCWNIECPKNQLCIRGECMLGGGPPSNPPADKPDASTGNRLLATGGGGCSCSVPGRPGTGSDSRGLGLLLGALGVLVLVRRRRAAWLGSWLFCTLIGCCALLAGCRVSPICLDCVDSGGSVVEDTGIMNASDSGQPNDAKIPDKDAGAPDAESDSAAPLPDSGPKCVATGDETCNGKDDDCDFKVDENVTPTTNSCNQVGVCTGTAPVCANGSFVCRYPALFEKTETLCDGKDNDCNGLVDEPFTQLGASCEVGIGACKVSGNQRCNAAHTALFCEIKTTAEPGEEVCNGKDDDCDGMVDEPKSTPGSNPSYVKDSIVQVRSDLWMYAYEASRVDATDTNSGIITARTCSRAGVLPWTNITYNEALAACQTADMQLCSLNDWIAGCRGSSGNCNWSYTPATAGKTCNDYEAQGSTGCNGHNVNAAPGSADTDALKAVGSKAECFADFGSGGHLFDMSGNAKEWTTGSMSPDQNPLRGGSYNNSSMGLRCDFDFTIGAPALRLANVGFRCCSNSAP
jgi:MYXO-CTERM domain-containing protein